jgi:hypothetical protein
MTDRAPNPLRIEGTNDDYDGNDNESWTTILYDDTITSWTSGEVKRWDIPQSLGGFKRFRIVWENNLSVPENGAQMTGVRAIGYETEPFDNTLVTYRGEIVTMNGEAVRYTAAP